MRPYLEMAREIVEGGIWRENRTGIKAKSIWGHMMRFDLQEGFPLVTTKKVYFHAVLVELIGFIQGITDVAWYQERRCNIWNEWASEKYACERLKLEPEDPGYAEGDLGPIYPHQWRFFGAEYQGAYNPDKNPELAQQYQREGAKNQLSSVVDKLRKEPSSRQVVMSAWNPQQQRYMALPPCHVLAQFQVRGGRLCSTLYQRSADVFLGVPFNIAQYALLTHLIAHILDLGVGTFVHFLADAHIYENHLEQVKEQLTRDPRPRPRLEIHSPEKQDIVKLATTLFDGGKRSRKDRRAGRYGQLQLHGYDPHPALKGKVAV